MNQYDNIDGAIRRDFLAHAEDEHQARLNRQSSMAQVCGEEMAEIVISVDLDDEVDLRASIIQIDAIAANARVFLLEALENKRLRRALQG